MSLCYDFQKWIIISLASVAISLTMGLVSSAYGQTLNSETGTNISFAYDNSSGFVISDASVKRAGFGNIEIIGIIQNNDSLNTVEGVSLAIQMYDRTNHLIDVETGDPQMSNFQPNEKTGFKIMVNGLGSYNILNLDHIYTNSC